MQAGEDAACVALPPLGSRQPCCSLGCPQGGRQSQLLRTPKRFTACAMYLYPQHFLCLQMNLRAAVALARILEQAHQRPTLDCLYREQLQAYIVIILRRKEDIWPSSTSTGLGKDSWYRIKTSHVGARQFTAGPRSLLAASTFGSRVFLESLQF